MKDCKSCEYETLCVIPESIRININDCKVYDPKKKKTNADRIRSMSDLELSNFIKSVHNDGTCREYALTHGQAFTDMFGNKGVWSWLQSEAE